ncbi:MAG: DUF5723 family protein [Prevotella sp.]|nr:DUF5723 family protein [Prevotella sp.]
MKFNINNKIVVAALLMSASAAMAQNTNSGYFTDSYLYRHEMNPAFSNEQNYVAMPALGNVNVAMRGNLAVSDVLYNVNGRTTTFLNPNVSASEFLGNINDKNRIGSDIKLEILSAGFKGWGGYNTIGISVRSNVNTTIPGSLLRLAKQGAENKTYDIKDFNAHADAYAELALGHSRKINEQWSVGGKFKVLLGGANIDAKFNKAQLSLGENEWTAVTNAEINTSIKGFKYIEETKMRGPEGDQKSHTYVNDMDVDGAGINGFGLALDLGAEFKLNDNWKFSAAVLDLGFINWSNNMLASTDGDKHFSTDKYIFNVDDDASNSFDNEINSMGEGLSSLYELRDKGDQGGHSKMLGATINLGAEYVFPYYKKLTFGLLSTTRLQSNYGWTECRLSANVAPVKCLSAGVNFAAGTYGCAFGWVMNVHTTGFNLFAAMDRTFASTAKQGIPLSGNGSVNVGINFPF